MPGVEVAFDILENLNKLFTRDGDINLDSVDWMSEDPNYIREVLRPAVIKEDVRFMEQRKRVTLILKSAAFRRQLDSIIQEQMEIASHPPESHPGLLQQQKLNKGASPMVSQGMNHTKSLTPSGLWPVAPINDVNNCKYSDFEKEARCKLASLCRIIDIHGWASISPFHHVSIRAQQNLDEIFVNPAGQSYHEVSANSILKVNPKGELVNPPPPPNTAAVDSTELKLHLAVFNANPNIRCVIHINTNSIKAVCGQGKLLQLTRESIVVFPRTAVLGAPLSSHELQRVVALTDESSPRLLLLPECSGLLALGTSVEEAWFYASSAVLACDTQLSVATLSAADLWLPSPSECQQLRDAFLQQHQPGELGKLEWAAMVRHLDNAGYRTGYQPPASRSSQDELNSRNREDVEIPACCVGGGGEPTASDTYQPSDPNALPYWMCSPHQYALYQLESTDDEGVEEDGIQSSGTEDVSVVGKQRKKRKCRARWIAKGNYEPTSMLFRTTMSTLPQPASCTAAEVEPNKFAPQGVDPKELKLRQRTLKKKYFADETSAGPSSQRLDGFTTEELLHLQRQGLAKLSADGKRLILLAATSQAVIEKDARHFTPVLGGEFLAATNPFERITDADLELYRQEVEISQNPELARLIREQQEREEQEQRLIKEREFRLREAAAAKEATVIKSVAAQPAAAAPTPATVTLHVESAEPDVGVPSDMASTSSPPKQAIKSDTSGVEDVEREGTDSEAVGKDKKKKRRFKMPSFSRKKKDSAK